MKKKLEEIFIVTAIIIIIVTAICGFGKKNEEHIISTLKSDVSTLKSQIEVLRVQINQMEGILK